MDRERFDALARLLARKGSRRGALGAIFGVAFLGQDPEEGLAKPGKGKKKGHDQGQRKGHDKDQGRGKGHDKGKGQGHTENDEPQDPVNDEAAAPEPEGDGPDLQAEGQSGRGKSQGKRRGKGKGNDKGSGRGKDKNKGRNDKSRNQRAQAEAIPARCCGRLSCAKPSPGSNRGSCNFAGQNLSGGNYVGTNFGKIDGRGTIFDNANVRGTNWGDACLQGAKFRGADVEASNFFGACLFDADFTGAKNLNVSVNFSGALLCRTILPDGTVSNRDCNKGTACCPACDEQHPCPNGQICCNGRCRNGDCCVVGDCPDEQCQTKACTGFNCEYTPISNGPGPLCNTTCCNGVCCAANQRCVNGQCTSCNAQTCPNGCCNAQGVCVSPPTNQQCGVPGATCAPCTGNTPLCDPATGRCVQCLNPANCPPAPVCQDPTCVDGVCGTTNEPNGTPCTIPGDGPGVCSNGTCVQCLTPANCPAPPACRDATCVDNLCGTTNEPNGTACETGQGSGVCCGGTCEVGDECCTNAQCPPAEPICSNGQCVQCENPNNCPPAPVCQDPTCSDGVCGTTNEPNNTLCILPGGGPGVCNNGTCVQCITIANCPAPPICRDATCVMGVCGTTNEPNGTACQTGQGSGVCCGGTCEVGDECCTNAQCPANEPICANGQCVQCLTPADCPTTPPECFENICDMGVCDTAPLNNEPDPGSCDGTEVCCSGVCVTAQAGQCPICCQNAPDCPQGQNCRGSGSCGNLGLEVCTVTDKCCVA